MLNFMSKKIGIILSFVFLLSLLFACQEKIVNRPRFIEMYSEYSLKNTNNFIDSYSPFSKIEYLYKLDNVTIGDAPRIVILCENTEKDTFLDVEIHDSYSPNSIIVYSGNSDEYHADSSTILDTFTEIWITKITIQLPEFQIFENRIIEIKGISFLRETISSELEAVIDDEELASITFYVDEVLPVNYYKEELYQNVIFQYYYINGYISIHIIGFEPGVSMYGETNLKRLPMFSQKYRVPSTVLGVEVKNVYIQVFDDSVPIWFTTLENLRIYFGTPFTSQPIFCSFSDTESFNMIFTNEVGIVQFTDDSQIYMSSIIGKDFFTDNEMTNIYYNYLE